MSIAGIVLGVLLPLVVFIYSLNIGPYSGILFIFSLLYAPVVFFVFFALGLFSQIVYIFSTAKNPYKTLPKLQISYSEGKFIVEWSKNKQEYLMKVRFYNYHQTKPTLAKCEFYGQENKKLQNDKIIKLNNIASFENEYFALVSIALLVRLLQEYLEYDSLSTIPTTNAHSNDLWLESNIQNFERFNKAKSSVHNKYAKQSFKRFLVICFIVCGIFCAFWAYKHTRFNSQSICEAVSNGDIERTKTLLESGTPSFLFPAHNPNQRCYLKDKFMPGIYNLFGKKRESSPLLIAIDKRNIEMVKTLLAYNANALDTHILTESLQSEKILRLLLESESVAYADTKKLKEVLNNVLKASFFYDEKIDGKLAALLLKYGADFDKTIFQHALSYSNNEAILLFMNKRPLSSDILADTDTLLLAFEYANAEVIIRLAKAGAKADSKILHKAFMRDYNIGNNDEVDEYERIVRLAINLIRKEYGSIDKEQINSIFLQLHKLPSLRLAIEAGADINIQRKEGNTQLLDLLGMIKTHKSIIFLLENGANKEIRNTKGKNALDIFNERFKTNPYNTRDSHDLEDIQHIESLLTH